MLRMFFETKNLKTKKNNYVNFKKKCKKNIAGSNKYDTLIVAEEKLFMVGRINTWKKKQKRTSLMKLQLLRSKLCIIYSSRIHFPK